MRCYLSLVCLAAVVVAVVEAAPQKISSKYDNVDIDRIIGNGRILSSYIKCAMDEGPCTAEGRELKKHLPDAIKSNCSGCSEAQKKNANKLITHMRTTRKRDWDRLVKKFDPTGEHAKTLDHPSPAAPSKTAVAVPAKPDVSAPAVPAKLVAAAPAVPAKLVAAAPAVPAKLVAAAPAVPAKLVAAAPAVPEKTESSS